MFQPEKQVRLAQERNCGEIARMLSGSYLHCDFTLVTFYFGDLTSDPFCSVEYSTSLPLNIAALTLSSLLEAWERGGPRYVEESLARVMRIPSADELRLAMTFVKEQLPEGRGGALICGRGDCTSYIGGGEREDLKPIFRYLVEQWRTATPEPSPSPAPSA